MSLELDTSSLEDIFWCALFNCFFFFLNIYNVLIKSKAYIYVHNLNMSVCLCMCICKGLGIFIDIGIGIGKR